MADVERVSSMVGTKVSIHTNEGTYTGIVSQSSHPPSKVVLSKVACVDNAGCELRLPGLITILDVEIISFEFVSLNETKAPNTSSDRSPQKDEGQRWDEEDRNQERNGKEERSPPSKQTQRLEESDAKPTTRMVNRRIPFDDTIGSQVKRPHSYMVVDQFGEMFDEAISMIQSCVVVGFGMDGVHLGRKGQLCWLQIATKDTVVLFDMMTLGCKEAFDSGLGQIMESTTILKIMHDCRQASDILQHKFGIRLNNVYDTQVADIMIYKKESGGYMPKYVRNQAVVLMDFMGLTENEVAFYNIRKSSLERDPTVWQRRPLTSILLQSAALSVRYLRELRLATLEVLLADLVEGVGMYLELVRKSVTFGSDAGNGQLLPVEFLDFGPLRDERSEGNHISRERHGRTDPLHDLKERYVNSPVPPYDKQFMRTRLYENQTDARQNGDVREDATTRRNSKLPSPSQQQDIEPRSNPVSSEESRNVFRRGDDDDTPDYRRKISNVVFYPA